ncbi:MAG: YciI family protein [Gaiellaceae bacterium]
MQYMLLIYSPPSDWQSVPAEQRQAIMEAYGSFTEELQSSGKLVAGDALQPISTATSIRVRDGETLTTDGPFAETKEVLGGYYLIDVETLDEALEWGAKIPGAQFGTIEVRPVVTDYETVA